MQAQFDVDHVMRIFFSSLMAPLGTAPRPPARLLRKRGRLNAGPVLFEEAGRAVLGASCAPVASCRRPWRTSGICCRRAASSCSHRREQKTRHPRAGPGFNLRELAQEDFGAGILSHFMLIELENIRYLGRSREEKAGAEMKIARVALAAAPGPAQRGGDLAVI
jgi:hypothetical protein